MGRPNVNVVSWDLESYCEFCVLLISEFVVSVVVCGGTLTAFAV